MLWDHRRYLHFQVMIKRCDDLEQLLFDVFFSAFSRNTKEHFCLQYALAVVVLDNVGNVGTIKVTCNCMLLVLEESPGDY